MNTFLCRRWPMTFLVPFFAVPDASAFIVPRPCAMSCQFTPRALTTHTNSSPKTWVSAPFSTRNVLPESTEFGDFERRWRLIWYLGEDRWLCTLMVQSGWRLEYCAAAEDSTYCPDNFDEFYKQRRRWIPSTLANLILLISKWNVIAEKNDGISFFFILYQALMVFSTIIRLVSKTLAYRG